MASSVARSVRITLAELEGVIRDRRPHGFERARDPGPSATTVSREPGATYPSSSRMMIGARAFHPRSSVCSGCATDGRAPDEPSGVNRWRGLARPNRLEVLRDRDRLIARAEDQRHRGVELDGAVARPDSDEGRAVECHQRVGEREPEQRRLFLEVDLVAAVVEQLRIDRGQSGLTAGLRHDAGDDVAGLDELRLVASDEPRRRHVPALADLRHDVELVRAALGMIRDRQDRLDHLGCRDRPPRVTAR